MAKENIFVTFYRKIFVGHGQGSLFASANPGSGPSEKSSPWRPSQTFTPPSIKKLLIAIKQKDFQSQPQFLLPTKKVSITILTEKKTHTKKQY